MKKIVISSTMSIDDAREIINTVTSEFYPKCDDLYRHLDENIEISNKIFTYTSQRSGDNLVEAIEINGDSVIRIIQICGNIYRTIKPMVDVLKNMLENRGRQFADLSGKTTKKVNGVEEVKPVKVRRHATIDGGKIKIDIQATANSEEEAQSIIDAEYKKLGM